jgi:hypothetical protein
MGQNCSAQYNTRIPLPVFPALRRLQIICSRRCHRVQPAPAVESRLQDLKANLSLSLGACERAPTEVAPVQTAIHEYVRERFHDRAMLEGAEKPIGVFPGPKPGVEVPDVIEDRAAREECPK